MNIKVLTIQVSSPSSLQFLGAFLEGTAEALVVLGFLVGGGSMASTSSSASAPFALFLVEALGFLFVVEGPGAFLFGAALVVFLVVAADFLVVVVEVAIDSPFAVTLDTVSVSIATTAPSVRARFSPFAVGSGSSRGG